MNDRLIINTSKKRTVKVVIQYVFRANFNDTYWLEERNVELQGKDGAELLWFDPFFGRSKLGVTRVAISYVSDKGFRILEDQEGKVKEYDCEEIFEHIVCEDYDDSMMLAAHIRVV